MLFTRLLHYNLSFTLHIPSEIACCLIQLNGEQMIYYDVWNSTQYSTIPHIIYLLGKVWDFLYLIYYIPQFWMQVAKVIHSQGLRTSLIIMKFLPIHLVRYGELDLSDHLNRFIIVLCRVALWYTSSPLLEHVMCGQL